MSSYPVIDSVRVAVMSPEGLVVMARRAEGHQQAGMLEVFGGKVDKGERPLDAAIRELDEEYRQGVEFVNLEPVECKPYTYVTPEYREKTMRVHAFLASALRPVQSFLSEEHMGGSQVLVPPHQVSELPNVTRASKLAMDALAILL